MLVKSFDGAVRLPEIYLPSRLLRSISSSRTLCPLETLWVLSQQWIWREVGRREADESELNVGKEGVARERKQRDPQGKTGQNYPF